MLKVSNKGRYAVRALLDLAFHATGEQPSQIRDIAERQRIPARFLEQIFRDLKRAQLVASKRGPRGGYALARAPERIPLGEVLRAVDGPIALVPEPSRAAAKRHGADLREVIDGAFRDVARDVERCFDAVTIEDLCARGERVGVRRRGRARPLAGAYVI